MRKLAVTVLVTALFAVGAQAQKQKPWGEWSQKDAQKILDDSPWGQTLVKTDTSEMFFQPTNDVGTSRASSTSGQRSAQGATNQAVNVNYHIRFFTAKPIREAFARLLEIKQPNLPKETVAQLDVWTKAHTDDWIIIAVTFDATDQRYSGPLIQAFGAVTTDLAKNNTYLERKDGQKVFLSQYEPPGKDGSGAKFVFARTLEGKPFLTQDSGEVRFYSEFSAGSNAVKMDRRFKLAEMVYEGQLEY
jgi:hypothetical protein